MGSTLYSGNNNPPLWTIYEDGKTLLLETSNYSIPILWYILFDEENLCEFKDIDADEEDDGIQKMFFADREQCIKRIESCFDNILLMLDNSLESIQILQKKLIDNSDKYISLDMTQVVGMLDDNEEDINEFLNIFNLKSEDNIREKILSLYEYNPKDRILIPYYEDTPNEETLIGFEEQ